MTFITIMTSGFSKVNQIGYHLENKMVEFIEELKVSDQPLERGYGIAIDDERKLIAFSYGKGNAIVLIFEYEIRYNKCVLTKFLGCPQYRMHNIHQIEFNDGLLYITNDLHARNGIDVYNPYTLERVMKYYIPRKHYIAKKYGLDNGLNTLHITDKFVWVGAHNGTVDINNPSLLLVFEKESGKLVDYLERGSQIHGYVRLPNGSGLWNDSNNFNICIDNDVAYELPKNQYARGIILHEEYVIVSTSDVVEREDRDRSKSKIFVFKFKDKKLELYDVIEDLPQIHDIRMLLVDEN